MTEELEGKIRKYRLIFHNIPPNIELVREKIAEELGEDVEVVRWRTEGLRQYQGRVAGANCLLPQCDTYVMVRYREIEGK